jgi:hypothetical protein
LLLQPGCEISAARDECIGLVDQVTGECTGGESLVRGLPGVLLH